MTVQRLLLCSCFLFFVLGCAPKTHYTWNGYDDKLYQHYKNPAEYNRFIEHLREIIQNAEETGKVPPGIYAEYGFVLYEKGNFQEAIKYFKFENDKWPESRVLMAKMIQNAQMNGKNGKSLNPPVVPTPPDPANPTMSEAKSEVKEASK